MGIVDQQAVSAHGIDIDSVDAPDGRKVLFQLTRQLGPAPQPPEALRQAVWEHLNPLRVLTTRHHIVGPTYVPINAEILIARRPDMPEEELREDVVQRLTNFLQPYEKGDDDTGWPFGRDVYVSELYKLLEEIPGVDYAPDIAIFSQCPPATPHCAAATEIWHEEGDQVGLELAAHHLPWAQIGCDLRRSRAA